MFYNKESLNKSVTYKNLLCLLTIVAVVLGLVYGFNKACKKFYTHKFEQILTEARKTDPNSWYEKYKNSPIKDKYKVVIVTNNGGEMTYTEYFKYAAEKKGWEVKIFNTQMLGHEDSILEFDPDFILLTCHIDSFTDSRINAHRSRKYALNLVSFHQLRSIREVSLKDTYQGQHKLGSLNAIVHGVLTVAAEVDVYKKMFERLNKPFNGFRLFPLVPAFENGPAEPKTLMWLSGGWDAYRSSNTYKDFIKLLSENVPMKVYGHYNSASYLKPGIYDGYIKPGIENMEAIRKNGIYLLTHSNFHFEGSGVPSMRIFEATAANAVVISDMHPFPLEHFGDNFLYFDHKASAQEIYKQIKSHMDWIKANPEKAKAMADRAHKIFLEKFTIEKDLERIAKMHEYVLAQEKEMNLSYPLGY